LDKTQSAATIFAIAKSTCAKKRISVNRFCSPGPSPGKGFVIFIVDSIHRESARASGRECSDEDFALPASWDLLFRAKHLFSGANRAIVANRLGLADERSVRTAKD